MSTNTSSKALTHNANPMSSNQASQDDHHITPALCDQQLQDINTRITRMQDYQLNTFLHSDTILRTKKGYKKLYNLRSRHNKRTKEISVDLTINFHLQDIYHITTTCPFKCRNNNYMPQDFLLHFYNHHLCINKDCPNIFSSRAERRDHIRRFHSSQQYLECTHTGCTYLSKCYASYQNHRLTNHTSKSTMSTNTCPLTGCLGDTSNNTPSPTYEWTTPTDRAIHYRDYHQQAGCLHRSCPFNANGLLELLQHTLNLHNTITCPCLQFQPAKHAIATMAKIMHPTDKDLQQCPFFPLLMYVNDTDNQSDR